MPKPQTKAERHTRAQRENDVRDNARKALDAAGLKTVTVSMQCSMSMTSLTLSPTVIIVEPLPPIGRPRSADHQLPCGECGRSRLNREAFKKAQAEYDLKLSACRTESVDTMNLAETALKKAGIEIAKRGPHDGWPVAFLLKI